METKLVTVTPEMAESILDRSQGLNFRKLTPSTVNRYANDMAAGLWELNGETIKITADGFLLDGQHRLAAIVQSGVTLPMLIVFGVTASAKHIDRGKNRLISDYLKDSQGNKIKNANHIAATAKLCLIHERDMWGQNTANNPEWLLDDHVFSFVEQYGDRMSDIFGVFAGVPKGISRSIIAAIVHLGTPKCMLPSAHPKAMEFMVGLRDGTGLTKTDPAYQFREAMLRSVAKERRITPYNQRMLASAAWNRMVRGQKLKHLRRQVVNKIEVLV